MTALSATFPTPEAAGNKVEAHVSPVIQSLISVAVLQILKYPPGGSINAVCWWGEITCLLPRIRCFY